MRRTLVVAAIGAAISLSVAVPAVSEVQPAIVGGENVSSAPWSAAVYRNGSFSCSGSVISPQWVLTARHCLGSGMSVRVGNVVKEQGELATVATTQAYTRGDLALLKLAKSVGASSVRLADQDPPTGSINYIYGWGRTSCDGPAAGQLKRASVKVTGSAQDAYNGPALASSGQSGYAWKGDSGGPQMYNDVVVGVASTADCAGRQYYASVAKGRAWIKQISGV